MSKLNPLRPTVDQKSLSSRAGVISSAPHYIILISFKYADFYQLYRRLEKLPAKKSKDVRSSIAGVHNFGEARSINFHRSFENQQYP